MRLAFAGNEAVVTINLLFVFMAGNRRRDNSSENFSIVFVESLNLWREPIQPELARFREFFEDESAKSVFLKIR